MRRRIRSGPAQSFGSSDPARKAARSQRRSTSQFDCLQVRYRSLPGTPRSRWPLSAPPDLKGPHAMAASAALDDLPNRRRMRQYPQCVRQATIRSASHKCRLFRSGRCQTSMTEYALAAPYFKFAFVRNPCERLVSAYFFFLNMSRDYWMDRDHVGTRVRGEDVRIGSRTFRLRLDELALRALQRQSAMAAAVAGTRAFAHAILRHGARVSQYHARFADRKDGADGNANVRIDSCVRREPAVRERCGGVDATPHRTGAA